MTDNDDIDITELFFGYVRSLETENKAMRLELELLKGSFSNQPVTGPEKPPAVARGPKPVETLEEPAPQIPEGKAFGYEGDPCPECGAMTMTRNGSCLKCMSCGTTTGCS